MTDLTTIENGKKSWIKPNCFLSRQEVLEELDRIDFSPLSHMTSRETGCDWWVSKTGKWQDDPTKNTTHGLIIIPTEIEGGETEVYPISSVFLGWQIFYARWRTPEDLTRTVYEIKDFFLPRIKKSHTKDIWEGFRNIWEGSKNFPGRYSFFEENKVFPTIIGGCLPFTELNRV